MSDTAKIIFSRVYQSYLTGGDAYSFYYKTENENKINEINKAINELENTGLVEIIHQNSKKTKMCITSEGITYGNNNF